MALIIFSDDAKGLDDLQAILDKFETRDVQEETAVDASEVSNLDEEFDAHADYFGEDLLEDDDLRLIVQIRTDDTVPYDEEASFTTWADTDIPAENLDIYRETYPEQEYRLVAVYDEIVNEVGSTDQQDQSVQSYEDEIGQLKAEILKLKAQLNFVENGGENF